MRVHQIESRSAALPRAMPSSSRMVASYLTDVEKLLEAQCWDAALCEACDLPRIAVALTDPTLHSSGEQQINWCDEWIRPEDVADEPEGLDYESLRRAVREQMESKDDHQGHVSVPARALRRLRLRRHVRTTPGGFAHESLAGADPAAGRTAQICKALVEAGRRWYARSACHDTTVQANLARLAVLR
jgi:hypothetical protein